MACWSPDDEFILTAGIDNAVGQHVASDGECWLRYAQLLAACNDGYEPPSHSCHEHSFDIPPLYRRLNYTRSYYMNDGAYAIVGSCEESTSRALALALALAACG